MKAHVMERRGTVWRAAAHSGAVLEVGAIPGPGLRTYVAVGGGLDVPSYLGSAATFTLGGFGGHGGPT